MSTKRQLKKLQKKEAMQANPQGSSSSTPRTVTTPRVKAIRPEPEPTPSKRETRVVRTQVLTSLANKLSKQHPGLYAKIKKKQAAPERLADMILKGPFRDELSKHFVCYTPNHLATSVVEHIQDRILSIEGVEQTKKSKHTEAQLKQREETPPPPTAPTSAYTRPKGPPAKLGRNRRRRGGSSDSDVMPVWNIADETPEERGRDRHLTGAQAQAAHAKAIL